MSTPYALGGLRSPDDPRDLDVGQFLPPVAPTLPPELDLRPCLQPVRNQGGEGTCGGFGLTGLMGYDEQTGQKFGRTLSPRDAYEKARAIAPVQGEGTHPRALLQAALQWGICLEGDRPYLAGSPSTPGPDAATHADQNRLGSYAAVEQMVATMKLAMWYHGPLLVASGVCDGFFAPDTQGQLAASGTWHDGGHIYDLVGWCDTRQSWLMRNSWDTTWGMGGYAWLPYTYPLWECWAATGALKGGAPVVPFQSWLSRLFPWFKAPW